jgi:2'-5' RNA ligase
MRTFIAFDLASEAKDIIGKIQLDFKKITEGKIKYIDHSQFHITVFFLGDIEQTQADNVKDLILKTSFEKNSILEFNELSYFPNIKRPNVIVLKSSPNLYLNEFVKDFNRSLSALGFKRDKGWLPHITIGRVKEHFKTSEFLIAPFKAKIENLSFYKSTLTSSGPIYEKLCQI